MRCANEDRGRFTAGVSAQAMNRASMPTLFQQILGAAFFGLAPCVRQLHGARAQVKYRGVASVERGSHPLAHLCARVAGLPAACKEVPTTVVFDVDPKGETWRRNFGGRQMISTLIYRDGLLHERLGALQFRFWLHVADGALWWQVAGVRLFGILPLPVGLFQNVHCCEREADGRYEFTVEAGMPLMGTIVRYAGWLEQVPADAT